MNMDHSFMIPKDAKNVNGNPGDRHPIFIIKICPFWFHVVLELDVNPQGSHLHFWHPKGSYNNDPYSFSMEDTPLGSNKLQDRCASPFVI